MSQSSCFKFFTTYALPFLIFFPNQDGSLKQPETVFGIMKMFKILAQLQGIPLISQT